MAKKTGLHLVDKVDNRDVPFGKAPQARLTASAVVDALRATKGVKLLAAQMLHCHRHTIDNYIARYPTVKAAYDEQTEIILDLAEGHVIAAITRGDLGEAHWYLGKKGRTRGYTEGPSLAVTGPDGGPLQVDARVLVGHLIERMVLNASAEIPQITAPIGDDKAALSTGADSENRP